MIIDGYPLMLELSRNFALGQNYKQMTSLSGSDSTCLKRDSLQKLQAIYLNVQLGADIRWQLKKSETAKTSLRSKMSQRSNEKEFKQK